MGRALGQLKPLEWIGSSKKDLKALPDEVMDVFGYALHLAQAGGKHSQAKPLQGFDTETTAGGRQAGEGAER
jgi:phage-related protein